MMSIACCVSGREDLNLRPPAPHAGALAGLRHAPMNVRHYNSLPRIYQISVSQHVGGRRLVCVVTMQADSAMKISQALEGFRLARRAEGDSARTLEIDVVSPTRQSLDGGSQLPLQAFFERLDNLRGGISRGPYVFADYSHKRHRC